MSKRVIDTINSYKSEFHITTYRLAELTGKDQKSIVRMLDPEKGNPTLANIMDILDAMGLEITIAPKGEVKRDTEMAELRSQIAEKDAQVQRMQERLDEKDAEILSEQKIVEEAAAESFKLQQALIRRDKKFSDMIDSQIELNYAMAAIIETQNKLLKGDECDA